MSFPRGDDMYMDDSDEDIDPLKVESKSSESSPHIIVTEVPPGFLKRRTVRGHFSRFGEITRLSIQNSFCIVTFETHLQAKNAKKYGTIWRSMPMKVDFTSNHDPFGSDDALINEELNWFAEQPGYSEKPKERHKSKSSTRSSNDPPKKIGRVDLPESQNEMVKLSTENKSMQKLSDRFKKSRERSSASAKFLEEIRAKSKTLDDKSSFRFSEVTKIPDEGDSSLKYSNENEGKSKESIPKFFEETNTNSEEAKQLPKFDIDSKSTFSGDGKSLFKSIFGNLNEGKTTNEDVSHEREPSPMFMDYAKAEDKSVFRTHEDRKRGRESPSIKGEGRSVLKASEDSRGERETSPVNINYSKPEGKSILRTYDERKKVKESSPVRLDYVKSENKTSLRAFEEKNRERDSTPVTSEYFKAVENKGISKPADKNIFSFSKVLEDKPLSKSSESSLKYNDSSIFNKPALTVKDKVSVLEERDRRIRQKSKNSELDSVLQGTCPDMCPEKERFLREVRNMVDPYEALPDGGMDYEKAVKEYTRSSADQGKPLPHELRPEPVLTMTMSYLINCIISRIDQSEEENLHNWYDFCWGRLRAIRKDIIQQDLCDENTVKILEHCARFHIACYDRLWGLSKSQFDDKLNTETLNNCLTSLIKLYKDLHHSGISCANEAEFNAYLILLNMNNGGFLVSEYQKYTPILKESPLIKEAVKIHLAYHNNMFSTYFKLIKNTSYHNACLAQRFFQHVRTEALNTIVKSHCTANKLSSMSLNFLMNMLKLDSVDDCVNFCESTGFEYSHESKSLKIYRNDFYISEYIYNIESPSSLVINKRVAIAEAVVGINNKIPVYLKHSIHESFTPDGFFKESAADASDQEEKMLRDNVERKLLLSQLKAALTKESQENTSKNSVLPSLKSEPIKQAIDDNFKEQESFIGNDNSLPYEIAEDVSQGATSESTVDSDSFDDQEGSNTLINDSIKQSPPKPSFTDGNLVPSLRTSVPSSPKSPVHFTPIFPFDKPLTNSVSPELTLHKKPALSTIDKFDSLPPINNDRQITSNFPPDLFTSQPLSKSEYSEKSVLSSPPKLYFNEPPLSNFNEAPKYAELEKPIANKSPSQYSRSISKDSLPNIPESESKIVPRRSCSIDSTSKIHREIYQRPFTKWEKSFSKDSISRERQNNNLKQLQHLDKLKRKLSENMKKVSARKYLRLWKEKVIKLRASKELEAMILHNLSTEECLKLWGKPLINRKLKTTHSLSTRKNSNLMVQMILYTDIIDRIDSSISKVGRLVVNALGEAAVSKADSWGNIAQPNPVFWKLVFALPPALKDGSTFGMKLRSWCKAAFYTGKDCSLSEAQLHVSDSGVPVVLSIHIVEGTKELGDCANLSALVVIRAKDWETITDTEQKIDKLVSLSNHPIPVAVLNIGQDYDTINLSSRANINYFQQFSWQNSKTTTDVLCQLAKNVYLFNLKVKPFCTLIEISSENIFDSLRQDSFLHDGLNCAITDPNKILLIYNQLIDRIYQEIRDCRELNYFGTAVDFKKDLEHYKNFISFPDNYNDINLVESLRLRCRKCKLQPFRIDLNSSKDFVSFLENYCDDIGFPDLLRVLLRYLKLPREESDVKLSDHLRNVQWLPFLEIIVKKILTSHLLAFKVGYRENVIRNILDSHFWLESDVLQF